MWIFPGGKIEPGKTTEAAAVRGTLEEAGLKVSARRVFGERVHPATRRAMTFVDYGVVTGTAYAADAGEVAEVAWCSAAQLSDYVPGGISGWCGPTWPRNSLRFDDPLRKDCRTILPVLPQVRWLVRSWVPSRT
jgi:8-oxo-dGTP pyrophosphatase MutT (NUDIX family)